MNAPAGVRNGCPSAETLAQFQDGRLEGAEREAVERHLASCAGCFEAVLTSARALAGAASAGAPGARAGQAAAPGVSPSSKTFVISADEVRGRDRNEGAAAPPPSPGRRWGWAVAAAGVAAAAIGVWALARRGGEGTTDPSVAAGSAPAAAATPKTASASPVPAAIPATPGAMPMRRRHDTAPAPAAAPAPIRESAPAVTAEPPAMPEETPVASGAPVAEKPDVLTFAAPVRPPSGASGSKSGFVEAESSGAGHPAGADPASGSLSLPSAAGGPAVAHVAPESGGDAAGAPGAPPALPDGGADGPRADAARPAFGRIVVAQGSPRLQSDAKAPAAVVKAGTELALDGVLKVSAGFAGIETNGAFVTVGGVGGGTTVQVKAEGDGVRPLLDRGALYVEPGDEPAPFAVATPQARVTVNGGDVLVTVSGAQTGVVVGSGEATVAGLKGGDHRLGAGQSAVVTASALKIGREPKVPIPDWVLAARLARLRALLDERLPKAVGAAERAKILASLESVLRRGYPFPPLGDLVRHLAAAQGVTGRDIAEAARGLELAVARKRDALEMKDRVLGLIDKGLHDRDLERGIREQLEDLSEIIDALIRPGVAGGAAGGPGDASGAGMPGHDGDGGLPSGPGEPGSPPPPSVGGAPVPAPAPGPAPRKGPGAVNGGSGGIPKLPR